MERSNFTFIPKEWEVIEYLAKTAEDNIYQDPNSSMVKLRMLGETLTKSIYVLEELTLPKGQYKRLLLLKENGLITNEIYEKLELIRQEGNTAVHTAGYGDIKSALLLSRYSYDLIGWFLKTYEETTLVFSDYVPPAEQRTPINGSNVSETFEQVFKDKLLELEKELQRVKENKLIVPKHNTKVNEHQPQGFDTSQVQNSSQPSAKQTLKGKNQDRQNRARNRMKLGILLISTILALFLVTNASVAFATGKFILEPIDKFFLHSNLAIKGETFREFAFKKSIDREDTKRIEGLLSLGVNPNIESDEGKLALILSIQQNKPELFQALISHGADPLLKNKAGTSPLDVAVEKENSLFIKALLNDKKVPDIADSTLTKLSDSNNTELLQSFLESGMDPNQRLSTGETFLIHAIQENKSEAVKMLLAHGADPNLQSESGIYPLHTSIEKGNIKVATLLLESGASPNLKDGNNKYPIELAHEGKVVEFEPVLLQFKSMSLFEIKLPNYIGYWKEPEDSPDRILEINKDSTGSWYMVVYSGNREETIQILPESNTFIPVSDTDIKALDGNFTKITDDEFDAEKKRLSSKQAVVAQAQQSSSTSSSSSTDSNSSDTASLSSSSSTNSNSSNTASPSQNSLEPNQLSKKMDSLIGVWKRVPPLNNETHDIRYIFVQKDKYSSNHSWKMEFVSDWTSGSGDFKQEELELIDNAIATLKRPALATYTTKGFYKTHAVRGYIFTLNSLNSINVEHLDHNDAQILNEEFRRISPNELEEEYLEIYNAVVN